MFENCPDSSKEEKDTRRKKKCLLVLMVVVLVSGVALLVTPLISRELELRKEAAEYDNLAAQFRAGNAATAIPPSDGYLADAAPDQGLPPVDAEINSVMVVGTAPESRNITGASRSGGATGNRKRKKGGSSAPSSGGGDGWTGADLAAAKSVNSDFVAWLTIPGTRVDYPVVSTDNPDYYLDHTFNGKHGKVGTLFSLGKASYKTPSQNIAIYGHNVESGGAPMFASLLRFKNESYFNKHPNVCFDTIYRSGLYKIFAVFHMTVGDFDPTQASFRSGNEFMQFVNRAKDLSMYDTGVDVGPNDQILTFITCDRSFKRRVGRLIVMAVRVSD